MSLKHILEGQITFDQMSLEKGGEPDWKKMSERLLAIKGMKVGNILYRTQVAKLLGCLGPAAERLLEKMTVRGLLKRLDGTYFRIVSMKDTTKCSTRHARLVSAKPPLFKKERLRAGDVKPSTK